MITYKRPTAVGRAAVRGMEKTAIIGSATVGTVAGMVALMRSLLGNIGEAAVKGPQGSKRATLAGAQALLGDTAHPGQSTFRRALNYKLAPAELGWPTEVGHAHGNALLGLPQNERRAVSKELFDLIREAKLDRDDPSFGFLSNASIGARHGFSASSGSSANKPWSTDSLEGVLEHLPVRQPTPPSFGKDLKEHVMPSVLWGVASGTPVSATEHLLMKRTHSDAGNRIEKAIRAVQWGHKVKKPSRFWSLFGGHGYRSQVENSAEAAARFGELSPARAKRLGELLVKGMTPDHHLHELGKQISHAYREGR